MNPETIDMATAILILIERQNYILQRLSVLTDVVALLESTNENLVTAMKAIMDLQEEVFGTDG